MILFSFAHPVETNRDFVKALLKLKETSDKLGTKPEIYFFDENMNNLNLRIFSGKFASKYRKGLEKDKSCGLNYQSIYKNPQLRKRLWVLCFLKHIGYI